MPDFACDGGPEDIKKFREILKKELRKYLPDEVLNDFLNKAYPTR